jgi:hypothetical protein
MVQREQLVVVVQPEAQVLLVRRVQLALLDLLAHLVQLDHPDLLDPREVPVQREQLVVVVQPEFKEQQEVLVPLVPMVQQEVVVQLEVQELLVPLVHPDQPEILE